MDRTPLLMTKVYITPRTVLGEFLILCMVACCAVPAALSWHDGEVGLGLMMTAGAAAMVGTGVWEYIKTTVAVSEAHVRIGRHKYPVTAVKRVVALPGDVIGNGSFRMEFIVDDGPESRSLLIPATGMIPQSGRSNLRTAMAIAARLGVPVEDRTDKTLPRAPRAPARRAL